MHNKTIKRIIDPKQLKYLLKAHIALLKLAILTFKNDKEYEKEGMVQSNLILTTLHINRKHYLL